MPNPRYNKQLEHSLLFDPGALFVTFSDLAASDSQQDRSLAGTATSSSGINPLMETNLYTYTWRSRQLELTRHAMDGRDSRAIAVDWASFSDYSDCCFETALASWPDLQIWPVRTHLLPPQIYHRLMQTEWTWHRHLRTICRTCSETFSWHRGPVEWLRLQILKLAHNPPWTL